MSKIYSVACAIAIVLTVCQLGMAQLSTEEATGDNADAQVIDDEVVENSDTDSAEEERICEPEEIVDGVTPDDCVEPEPVYVPVEPPPVLSDEIQYTDPEDKKAREAEINKATADLQAVESALGEPLKDTYQIYQNEIPDRNISFAQYMYNDYKKERRAGILFISIGVPVFGGLTALGAVMVKQAHDDVCLSSNESNDSFDGCTAPQIRDADDKNSSGVFLLAFGASGTIASIVVGAIKYKRGSGPMKKLEPVLDRQKSAKSSVHFTGFSPIVTTANAIAPGPNFSFSF